MRTAGFDSGVVRQRLVARREELSLRRRRIDADLHHRLDPLVADFADQAVQTQNDETLAAIDASVEEEMAAIETALRRLDAGKYGSCARCGEPIELARLEAIPYGVVCTRCANESP